MQRSVLNPKPHQVIVVILNPSKLCRIILPWLITVPYLPAHLSARRGIWFRREPLLLLPGAQLLASELQISAPAPEARLNWLEHFSSPKSQGGKWYWCVSERTSLQVSAGELFYNKATWWDCSQLKLCSNVLPVLLLPQTTFLYCPWALLLLIRVLELLKFSVKWFESLDLKQCAEVPDRYTQLSAKPSRWSI